MSNQSSNNEVTFAGLLTVLFVGLKLSGIINWSWWWILSPLWISVGFVIIVAMITLIALSKGE